MLAPFMINTTAHCAAARYCNQRSALWNATDETFTATFDTVSQNSDGTVEVSFTVLLPGIWSLTLSVQQVCCPAPVPVAVKRILESLKTPKPLELFAKPVN